MSSTMTLHINTHFNSIFLLYLFLRIIQIMRFFTLSLSFTFAFQLIFFFFFFLFLCLVSFLISTQHLIEPESCICIYERWQTTISVSALSEYFGLMYPFNRTSDDLEVCDSHAYSFYFRYRPRPATSNVIY